MRLRGGKEVKTIFASGPDVDSASSSDNDLYVSRMVNNRSYTAVVPAIKPCFVKMERVNNITANTMGVNEMKMKESTSEFSTTSLESLYEKKLLKPKKKKESRIKAIFSLLFWAIIGLVTMIFSAVRSAIYTSVQVIVLISTWPVYTLPIRLYGKCFATSESGGQGPANIEKDISARNEKSTTETRNKKCFTPSEFGDQNHKNIGKDWKVTNLIRSRLRGLGAIFISIILWPIYTMPIKIYCKFSLQKSGDSGESTTNGHKLIAVKMFISALFFLVKDIMKTTVKWPTIKLPKKIYRKCLNLWKSGDEREEDTAKQMPCMETRRRKLVRLRNLKDVGSIMKMKTAKPKRRSMLTYVVRAITVIAIVCLLWNKFIAEEPIPDPITLGLENCQEIDLLAKGRVRAWHVSPAYLRDRSITEALTRQGESIVIVFRKYGKLGTDKRIKIIKNLALNNNHVLISLSPLNERELLMTWYQLNYLSKGAKIYTWFDGFEEDHVQGLSKAMCLLGSPPSGIIMQTEGITEMKTGFLNVKSWPNKCSKWTLDKADNGKFNIAKCPINVNQNDNDVQLDVHECLKAAKTVHNVWDQLGSVYTFFRTYYGF